MTVDENGGLTVTTGSGNTVVQWWCKNCATTWPENFCRLCGRDLKAADLTTDKAAGRAHPSGASVTGQPKEHR